MARKRSTLQRQQSGYDIAADWSKGMVTDAPRTAVPVSAVVDSVDFLLHQPGLMQKRGGWSYYGGDPAPGTNAFVAVAFAEFSSGNQVLAIGDDGSVYKFEPSSNTSVANLGSAYATKDKPKLRIDKLIVCPNTGTDAPKYYDGSSFSDIDATTPDAKFAEVYKTRLVLAGSSSAPNRLYFSPTPDITDTWDTANSYIDCDYTVTGLAATSNMLLIFSQGHTERIIGSTPPPGSDMDRTVIGSVGCTDARSICVQENNVIFANPRGVWLTNGAGFASLTTEGMIESYWQEMFDEYDPATWSIAAGIYRSFYFVSVLDETGSLVDCLMCNVPRRAWWRLSNVNASMFAQSVGAQDELFFSINSFTGFVGTLSGIFEPTQDNAFDGDDSPVEPYADLRIAGSGPGLKHFGFGNITYQMTDELDENPTLEISVGKGVNPDDTDVVPESPIPEADPPARKRFTVGRVDQGVSVLISQTNASTRTDIYAVEIQERPLNQSAGGPPVG